MPLYVKEKNPLTIHLETLAVKYSCMKIYVSENIKLGKQILKYYNISYHLQLTQSLFEVSNGVGIWGYYHHYFNKK